MAPTSKEIHEIFKGLESGDGSEFFRYVSDDVDWIVEGTHPLAGHYVSKENFLRGTFAKLSKVLPHGAQLRVEHVVACGDWASLSYILWRWLIMAFASTTDTAGFAALTATRSSKYAHI